MIAVPSKGRAAQIGKGTLRILPNTATVFCPEAELEEYRKACPEAADRGGIVGVPDTVRGITATRNWILDNVPDRWVVMVDDDPRVVGYVDIGVRTYKHVRMNEPELIREWGRLFELTEDMGFRVWGCATQSDMGTVYPYKPFLWRTYVTASCMGIVNDPQKPLRFDEAFPVKEDYELCLRAIKEDGGVVGARYLYWENYHWEQEGGCRDYRTQEMEEACIRRLMDMYPEYIRRVKRKGNTFAIQLDF